MLTVVKRKGHIVRHRALQGSTRVGQEAEGVGKVWSRNLHCDVPRKGIANKVRSFRIG